jgi:hypothetical protein
MTVLYSIHRFLLLALLVPLLPAGRCLGEDVLCEQKLCVRRGKIIVPVGISGEASSMIFDTGCYIPAFDVSMRSHVGQIVGKTRLNVFGGAMDTELYQAPSMSIGRWMLAPSEVVVMDFARFSAMLGLEVRGVLGTRCLRQTAIELNFDRQQLRFVRHYQAPEKSEGMQYVPLKFDEAGPIITSKIEEATVHLIVDTGFNVNIGLRHGTFEKLVGSGAIVKVSASKSDVRQGAKGPFTVRVGRFTRGYLLGIDLKDTPVEDDGDVDVLGLQFLSQLNSVLDLPGKRFYFERCGSVRSTNNMN